MNKGKPAFTAQYASQILMQPSAATHPGHCMSRPCPSTHDMPCAQDVHYYIRAAMCQQLVSIAKAVGPELTVSQLLDELFELLKDEEIKVGGAAAMGTASGMDK